MSQEYQTVAGSATYEIKISHSRFIGDVAHTQDREAAEAFVLAIRQRYPDATHHCFAYRMDENIFRFYDDGEPRGTAGLPILKVLDKYRLRAVTLVVTRYFGGIKLGTGGLARAYARCAEETILKAGVQPFVQYHLLTVNYEYPHQTAVNKLLKEFMGEVRKTDYSDVIRQQIAIPLQHHDDFIQALRQITAGRVNIIEG